MIELKNKSLAEIVNKYNVTSEVFLKYFVDYCTEGDVLLKDYFENSEIELQNVLNELGKAISNLPEDNIDFNELSIAETCELIRGDHHEYLRNKISELTALSMKIHKEEKSKAMNNIHNLLLKIFNHLAPHMLQEEKVVFPYLEYMEHIVAKGKVPKPPSFGRVKKNVATMLDEHQDSADQLNELRSKTNNYSHSNKSNGEVDYFYKELEDLDRNLRMHIHIENNVL
ncbi:MAG: DUF542 domain-containing protein, partial [Bacteroidota bacterium]